MDNVKILPVGEIGSGFIPREYLPDGQDEYYLRNEQVGKPKDYWRALRSNEIEILVKNGNTCDDWDNMLVTDCFEPSLIKNSEFFGLVRIGRLQNVILQHHDLRIPAGIVRSRVIACDLGDDVAIHDVHVVPVIARKNRKFQANVLTGQIQALHSRQCGA